MNITLLYDYLLEEGGLERVMATQAKYLAKNHNVRVSFATFNRRLLKLFEGIELREHSLNLKNHTFKIMYSFLDKGILRKSKDTDLFISHSFICSSLAYHMKQKQKTPYVIYMHHPPNFLYFKGSIKEWGFDLGRKIAMATGITLGPLLRILDKKYVRAAEKVFVNSYYTKRRIEKIYGIDATVIYPTLYKNFSLKKNEETKYVLEKYNLKKFIFCTGRLIPDKKYDWLIEAFALLENKEIELVIAGRIGKEYEYLLRNLAIRSGCMHRIKFLGYVSDQDLIALYNQASLFAFPAPEEDFGLVPVEAMACGCPVVAWADNAGPSETVIEGLTGYLARPYNHKDFSEKMALALQTKFNKIKIAKSVEKFKEEEQMKLFLTEIESLVGFKSKYN